MCQNIVKFLTSQKFLTRWGYEVRWLWWNWDHFIGLMCYYVDGFSGSNMRVKFLLLWDYPKSPKEKLANEIDNELQVTAVDESNKHFDILTILKIFLM